VGTVLRRLIRLRREFFYKIRPGEVAAAAGWGGGGGARHRCGAVRRRLLGRCRLTSWILNYVILLYIRPSTIFRRIFRLIRLFSFIRIFNRLYSARKIGLFFLNCVSFFCISCSAFVFFRVSL
jgi:hypothetical protein